MTRITVIVAAVFSCVVAVALPATAQVADSTSTAAPAAASSEPSKVYYGGTIGFSFGDYFRISIAPLVGYQVNPKVSVGGKVGYEYIEDKRFDPKLTASNYGGSLFSRLRFVPQAYLHGEFAYWSYEYSISAASSERDWVPFLLLGGGAMQRISPRSWAFVEVLFDVLQSDKSPYDNWQPWVSVGVTVGM